MRDKMIIVVETRSWVYVGFLILVRVCLEFFIIKGFLKYFVRQRWKNHPCQGAQIKTQSSWIAPGGTHLIFVFQERKTTLLPFQFAISRPSLCFLSGNLPFPTHKLSIQT